MLRKIKCTEEKEGKRNGPPSPGWEERWVVIFTTYSSCLAHPPHCFLPSQALANKTETILKVSLELVSWKAHSQKVISCVECRWWRRKKTCTEEKNGKLSSPLCLKFGKVHVISQHILLVLHTHHTRLAGIPPWQVSSYNFCTSVKETVVLGSLIISKAAIWSVFL